MKESTRVLILVVLYSVGLISIYVPALKPWCLPLTPLNLLISFLFLLQAYQWEKQLSAKGTWCTLFYYRLYH